MGYRLISRCSRALAAAVAVAAVLATFGPSSASAAITCTKTQNTGESVSAFLNRLGSYEEGCLNAGTYDLGGNLTNFKAGQKLHPAPAAGGGYQQVTLRGTMTLRVNDLVLNDLFIVGVQNSQNSKIVEIGSCNGCKLDHLDITSAPQYVSFQGILNYATTTGLEITNNKIHHVGGNGQFDHGIYCHSAMNGGVIRGNWIYANASFGIQFYPDCDGVDFSYNVVDGNGARAVCPQYQDCPASSSNGRGVTVSGDGSSRTDNMNAHNNVFSTYGAANFSVLACYAPGTNDWVKDSLLYQASGSDDDCGSSISRSNLIHNLSPAYVNRTNRDYRLQSSSPARTLMGSYADAVPGPRLDSGSPPPPADTTPPDTMLGSGPSGTTSSTSASLTFSSSESGASFECRLDGGAWSACVSPKAYSGLADGSHSFDVRAKDAAGNTDATPASRGWTVDSTAPSTTLSSGPSGTVNTGSASFSFSSEAGAGFDCRIDSGAWTSCTSPKSYSGLSDGSHTFEVRARDAVGNTDTSPASRTWSVDTTPPETTIGSGPSGSTTSTSASFGFAASESGSSFECRIDSGAWSACTSPRDYSGLADGSHSFDVRAKDAVGNTDPSPASRTWTVDQPEPAPATPPTWPAPTVSFQRPTAGQTVSGRLGGSDCRVGVSSSTAVDRVEFFVDGKLTNVERSAPWSCSVNTRSFPDGEHTIRAVAYDAAGQSGSGSVAVNFANRTKESTSTSKESGSLRPWRGRLRLRVSARRRALRFAVSVPSAGRASVRRVRVQAFMRGRWRTVAAAGSPSGRFRARWRLRRARPGMRLRLRATARGALPSKALKLRLRR